MPASTVAAVAGLLAAAIAAVPAAPAAAVAPPPIVVVVFDELPTYSLMAADETVNAARFPSFARLARSATWYRNATTVADTTIASVPALLTGRRPGLVDAMPGHPERNLFTLVRGTHRIHALEPMTRICPPGLCDHATGAAAPPLAGRDSTLLRLRAALRLVRSIRGREDRPPLYFLHAMVPHVPWQFLPSGHRYRVLGKPLPGIRGKTWGTDAFRLRQAMQRHLLQVGYADHILGEVLARMRRSGLWTRALLVVTADHGMSIRPRGNRRRVREQSFTDIGGVPLFVKWPGRGRAAVSAKPVRTIDILPTISRALGDPLGWRFEGRPLRGGPFGRMLRVRNASLHALVEMPVERLAADRRELVGRWTRILPGGWRSVQSSNAADPLIGTAVARLRQARGGCSRAAIRDEGFARVHPRGGFVPVYVEGRVSGCTRAHRRLAVAVDGRVRAVARSYRERGAERFSALVPRRSLRRGAHSVAVYEIRPDASLRPLGALPAPAAPR